jgi:hypothetical protein
VNAIPEILANNKDNIIAYSSFLKDKQLLIGHLGDITQARIIDWVKSISIMPFFSEAHVSFKNTFRNILIEVLQNALKHGQHHPQNLFILALQNQTCYGYCINQIEPNQVSNLQANMDELNSISSAALDEKFKFGVANNEIYGNGNAGLGLLEIVRKSNRPIQYKILKSNSGSYHFNLQFSINIKSK